METGLAGVSGVLVQSRVQTALLQGQGHVITQLHSMTGMIATGLKMKMIRALPVFIAQVCVSTFEVHQEEKEHKTLIYFLCNYNWKNYLDLVNLSQYF